MKNRISIISTALLSAALMAFGINTTYEKEATQHPEAYARDVYTNLFYNLTPRFQPITKTNLAQASSVADFFGPEHLQPLLNYESIEVVIIENDKQTSKRLASSSCKLSEAQIQMLENLGYSQHFLIRATYHVNNGKTGVTEIHIDEPHFTVVPEKQATYNLGEKALIDYLEAGNKENTANLDENKLQTAKLYFTVTKNGTITNAHLDRTSGYEKMDAAMIELLTNAPGKWTPAQNAIGEKVDQELAITFGVGC